MTPHKAVEGCKKQDRISQKYIFDRWSEGMLMLCMRYVQNLHDAEELMLNGFYNFFRTIDRFVFVNEQSISAWLKRIMVNECLMHLRKANALRLADEQEAAEVPADDMLARLNAAELFRLIGTLPAGYRTVFNMYVVEGYSHKEIAEVLGITEGTSKSQLSKARLLMQKLVKENMLL